MKAVLHNISESELIRESVCACAQLFVDEESTWHKSNRGIEQKHSRIIHENDTKRRIQQEQLCTCANAFSNEFTLRSYEYCAGKHWILYWIQENKNTLLN
jgi:hypothetical protein